MLKNLTHVQHIHIKIHMQTETSWLLLFVERNFQFLNSPSLSLFSDEKSLPKVCTKIQLSFSKKDFGTLVSWGQFSQGFWDKEGKVFGLAKRQVYFWRHISSFTKICKVRTTALNFSENWVVTYKTALHPITFSPVCFFPCGYIALF